MNEKEVIQINKDIKDNIKFFNLLIGLARAKIEEQEYFYEILNGETVNGTEVCCPNCEFNIPFKGLKHFIKG